MTDDIFDDIAKLRVPGTPAPAPSPPGADSAKPQSPNKPKLTRVQTQKFVMVPMAWKERLKGASGAACNLAHELLAENWRSEETVITVSNIRATRAGVSRKRKPDALKQLEERGLVRVERSGKGRSPRATLLMLL